MKPSVLVADFEISGRAPDAGEIVGAAVDRGAQFLAVAVEEGDKDAPDAVAGGVRIARLSSVAAAARRRQVGLVARVTDTLVVYGLREALGVAKGASAAELRDRFLVVVATDRVGKRVRSDARELPSAYEIPRRPRGFARFTSANMQRAAADCDDLVVPWGTIDEARIASRIVPDLARRGGRVWLSDVPPDDVHRAAALPVAGVVVRFALRCSG